MLLVKLTLFISVLISFIPWSHGQDRRDQIAFYKSKNSPFPSGELSYEDLKKTRIKSSDEVVKYESEYYQYGQQKIATQLIKPTFATSLNLTKSNTDIGYFQTMVPTSLRLLADTKSKKVLDLAAGIKLRPLKYAHGYIEVQYKNKKGFVDISHCISKFDFAYAIFAQHPKTLKNQWHYVKSRLFDQIETHDGSMIPLSAIVGVSVHTNVGIITKRDSSLPLWSKVKLQQVPVSEKSAEQIWSQSYVKKHGFVWWKSTLSDQKKSVNENVIDFEALLKKEIFSTSFLSDNPKKSIVSTQNGVYITDNGVEWKKIEQLGQFKGPVLYYNSNMIFAGSFRSLDHGKTFQQFVNINTLSQQLKNTLGYNPRAVKIQKISPSSSSQIIFDVLADSRKLKLQSLIYNQEWKVIK
jgi:hypothetical protein